MMQYGVPSSASVIRRSIIASAPRSAPRSSTEATRASPTTVAAGGSGDRNRAL